VPIISLVVPILLTFIPRKILVIHFDVNGKIIVAIIKYDISDNVIVLDLSPWSAANIIKSMAKDHLIEAINVFVDQCMSTCLLLPKFGPN
jgi:hypothetical protein